MQISLINGFYIEIDSRQNHTLRQKYTGTKKDGTRKESVRTIGHYGSLEQAIDMFLRLNQVPPEAKFSLDLREYVNLVEESNKRAVQAVKSVLEGKGCQ